MKCINKLTAVFLALVFCVSFCACGKQETPIKNAYSIDSNNVYYSMEQSSTEQSNQFFSANLCVGGTENVGTDTTDSQVAGGAGLFNTVTGEIPYAQNIYDKMYPASTTKILTAYLAIKYGNLDDVITISENAVALSSDSSTCNLRAGDQMTLRDLLYGLMMRSGNDAAIAIAEHISGDIDSFAKLMNDDAKAMGATHSNFVNPNGLPDDNHYTCVYDLYLIFNEAIKDETFYNIIHTTSYATNYTSDGVAATQDWTSTNQYFADNVTVPDGFTIIGAKTGTTGEAGYCLVLLSENSRKEPIISIVLKADCRSNLYLLMNQMLNGYGN